MNSWLTNIENVPLELQPGLLQITQDPQLLRLSPACPEPGLNFIHDPGLCPGAYRVEPAAAGQGGILIEYGDRSAAFRALGRLGGLLAGGCREPLQFAESTDMELRCVMIDCSRNGVLTVAAVKKLLRHMALMGLNSLMLYTEDTFEIPGEPFFGYLRGGYTQAELRELDSYADAFGIEMFPCIQTLGHLSQVLQWEPYTELMDVPGVLLAGADATYAFIEKMIDAARAPFRSRRIHIGMDEAWGMGTGRFRKKFGDQDRFAVFNRHLARVLELCRARGLQPLIWSDMYFSMAAEETGKSGMEIRISESVARQIPPDVTLVGWEYGHRDQAYYEWFIDAHRQLGCEPALATSAWTTSRFWCALPYSLESAAAAMNACRQKKVRQVIFTVWGDDGMNCDYFSMLPALQAFAERAYAAEPDPASLRNNFLTCCGADFAAWVRAGEIDENPFLRCPDTNLHASNGGYALLWQDPLLAVLEPCVNGLALRRHYAELAGSLEQAATVSIADERLLFPARCARVLALKCHLRTLLADAYARQDLVELKRLLEQDLKRLRAEFAALWEQHRDLWMSMFKPFGWEVVEARYGRMLARLDTTACRLQDYLDGRTDEIPELEVRLENVFPDAEPDTIPLVYYNGFLVTPSTIRM